MPDDDQSPAERVRAFYEARKRGDPETLRDWLAEDVIWNEPQVGDHMGTLHGAHAVIDMLRRAQAATGGTFALAVAETMEVGDY